MDERKRPVSPNREEGHSPARPRPGVRSARRGRWPSNSNADRVSYVEDPPMNRTTWFQRRRQPKRRAARARPQVELLETRNLLSSGLTLTPLVQVSDPSPLGSFLPPGGTTFKNSEV